MLSDDEIATLSRHKGMFARLDRASHRSHTSPERGRRFAMIWPYANTNCPVCSAPVQRIVYAENGRYCAKPQTSSKLLADRSLSRLLKNRLAAESGRVGGSEARAEFVKALFTRDHEGFG
jgi:hypothetical protein